MLSRGGGASLDDEVGVEDAVREGDAPSDSEPLGELDVE